MSAYMIARIEVTNLEGYMEYASQTVAIAKKFGGKFLVKGGPMQQLEGTGPDRHVVIEFENMNAAKAFYTSEEYAKILPIALANSKRDAVLVEGP